WKLVRTRTRWSSTAWVPVLHTVHWAKSCDSLVAGVTTRGRSLNLRDHLPRLVIVLAVSLVGLNAAPVGATPRDPWSIDWLALSNSESGLRASSTAAALFAPTENADASRLTFRLPALASDEQATQPRPHAIEYSHGYEVRRKIHVYASFAMIPLFVT